MFVWVIKCYLCSGDTVELRHKIGWRKKKKEGNAIGFDIVLSSKNTLIIISSFPAGGNVKQCFKSEERRPLARSGGLLQRACVNKKNLTPVFLCCKITVHSSSEPSMAF